MNKIRIWLSGKKSYIAGFGVIIAGLVQWIEEGDLGKLITRVLEGLAIMGVRAAISKTKKE